IVQPGFVQGLVEFYGFSEQEVGYIASAEIWGLALTTLLLAFGGHRYSWQNILKCSLILFVLGNLVSLTATSMFSFSALRFITGLGSGGMVSLTFTIIGITAKADRNFSLLIMGVLTYGAFGLWSMPAVFEAVGMNGVIIFFAVFGGSGWWFLPHLPNSGEEQLQIEDDAVNLGDMFRVCALLAMFTYFLAQGVIWAYLFLIGLNGGVSEQEVANGLMLSQFLGIAGAMIAALAGNRFGRTLPLAIGILGGGVVLFWLFGTFTSLVYAITVCIYNFAWNMTHPYLLASMASFDQHGKVVVYAVAAQMLGLAIGPAFAASLIQQNDYSLVIMAGMVLFLLSFLMILIPLLAHQRQRQRLQLNNP
ncbi:MAG: MFS transporter, partial [Pseudomonadales bacterium]|nr:MFS transporter [Pseudomonadales bacterium]